jgi:hypothetical protein
VPARTYLLIARVPAAGRDAFARYEAAVLPLLADHGARLERRLRSADGAVEAHVLRFPGDAALEAYRADPRRAEAAPLLERSGAVTELHAVTDV